MEALEIVRQNAVSFVIALEIDQQSAAREALLSQIAVGRLGRPEDIASVIRFLAGPGASYITGQVLVVDGGMVI